MSDLKKKEKEKKEGGRYKQGLIERPWKLMHMEKQTWIQPI